MWHCVFGWAVHDIVKDYDAFIFRAKKILKITTLQSFKCQELLTQWHCVTSKKTEIRRDIAVITLDLPW